MSWIGNILGVLAIGVIYVGLFTVIAGFAFARNPVVVWPMAAVASVIMLTATGVAVFKSD